MRKSVYLLALLLLSCTAFAQTNLPFTSLKPFNKGNFKIDASYSRMMQNYTSLYYPDFRVDIGYGITNWCVVGVFGSFGIYENNWLTIGGGYSVHDTDTILLPNFYFIDMYCRGELGMRTVTEQYIPDYDADYIDPVHNDFLIDGSLGVAINPSKYFGIFYEYAYDNLNKKTINYSTGTKKTQPIHRFGLNVRFGGPKKWQR